MMTGGSVAVLGYDFHYIEVILPRWFRACTLDLTDEPVTRNLSPLHSLNIDKMEACVPLKVGWLDSGKRFRQLRTFLVEG